MMNGQDFHVERSRFSCWTVEIFMMNGPVFHVEQSKFSWWTVKIFMLNGRDFHVDRSRFSCWPTQIFMMTGRDFHDFKDFLLTQLKSHPLKGTSRHPGFMENCLTYTHTCYDNGGCFLFCWRLMLFRVTGVQLENTCAVSGKWISPGLF